MDGCEPDLKSVHDVDACIGDLRGGRCKLAGLFSDRVELERARAGDMLQTMIINTADKGDHRRAPPALDADRHALFLDVDGALLDIAERPEDATADAALRGLLRRVAGQMNGAVALVTGRTIADAERIFGGAVEAIAGLHGMEIRLRPDVVLREASRAPSLRAVLSALDDLRRRGALEARIENKGASVALHYRHAPRSKDDTEDIAHALATTYNLKILRGKMVVELLSGDSTKGEAIDEFMRHGPFAGRVPIAIGDDATDEDAFLAAARLGGAGILVGRDCATLAKHSFADVAAVRAWLMEACV
jgi:trehalose 6-phosphate phosphatase